MVAVVQVTVRERLARTTCAPASWTRAAMASDQRSDVYVARLESSLTASETVRFG